MIYSDFEPHSVIKVISSTKTKKTIPQNHENPNDKPRKAEIAKKAPADSNVNEMMIRMISKQLYQQVFPNSKTISVDKNLVERWELYILVHRCNRQFKFFSKFF